MNNMKYDFSMTPEQRLAVALELRAGTLLPPIITHEMEEDLAKVDVEELKVPTRVGLSRVIKVSAPIVSDNKIKSIPLFINFHGGGFVRGYHKRDTIFCAQMALNTGCLVLDVDYRLAPEHPFPQGLNECYDVVAWAFKNAEQLGVDPSKIVVGGHSAGGNFATVIAIMAKETGDFNLAGQVLDYPFVDGVTPPEEKLDERSIMPTWRMDAFNVLYAQVPENLSDPRYSPVLATQEALTGLPPALFLIAGMDPLRFEAQRYASQLISADVNVDVHQFPNNDHGFVISARPGFEKGRETIFNWVSKIFK